MEMHALPRAETEDALRTAGARIVCIYRYDGAGSPLESRAYLACKPERV